MVPVCAMGWDTVAGHPERGCCFLLIRWSLTWTHRVTPSNIINLSGSWGPTSGCIEAEEAYIQGLDHPRQMTQTE